MISIFIFLLCKFLLRNFANNPLVNVQVYPPSSPPLLTLPYPIPLNLPYVPPLTLHLFFPFYIYPSFHFYLTQFLSLSTYLSSFLSLSLPLSLSLSLFSSLFLPLSLSAFLSLLKADAFKSSPAFYHLTPLPFYSPSPLPLTLPLFPFKNPRPSLSHDIYPQQQRVKVFLAASQQQCIHSEPIS